MPESSITLGGTWWWSSLLGLLSFGPSDNAACWGFKVAGNPEVFARREVGAGLGL
jgi:hypothetical protein